MKIEAPQSVVPLSNTAVANEPSSSSLACASVSPISVDRSYQSDLKKSEFGRTIRLGRIAIGQEVVIGPEGDCAFGMGHADVQLLHAIVRREPFGVFSIRPFNQQCKLYVAPGPNETYQLVVGELNILPGTLVRMGESYSFRLPPLEITKELEIGTPVLVGRHDNADIKLPREDKRLSREHLTLALLANGNFRVEDGYKGRCATNGTEYQDRKGNWAQIEGRVELPAGTLLRLAGCFLLEIPPRRINAADIERINAAGLYEVVPEAVKMAA